jgi:arsenate reductase
MTDNTGRATHDPAAPDAEQTAPDAQDPVRQRVLFVCTHNSARSIMAEALLRDHAADRYEVCSAGTHAGEVRPLTLRVLREAGLPLDGLRAEPTSDYLDQPFDLVVTVCDEAEQECPVFPRGGERQHWSFPDPSAVSGSDSQRLAAFREVFFAISDRIDGFLA